MSLLGCVGKQMRKGEVPGVGYDKHRSQDKGQSVGQCGWHLRSMQNKAGILNSWPKSITMSQLTRSHETISWQVGIMVRDAVEKEYLPRNYKEQPELLRELPWSSSSFFFRIYQKSNKALNNENGSGGDKAGKSSFDLITNSFQGTVIALFLGKEWILQRNLRMAQFFPKQYERLCGESLQQRDDEANNINTRSEPKKRPRCGAAEAGRVCGK